LNPNRRDVPVSDPSDGRLRTHFPRAPARLLTRRELKRLPERHRHVREPDTYEVWISDELEAAARETRRECVGRA
jgi:hypothetical protein